MSSTRRSSFINQLHLTQERWFAVHTRSKSEKAVQRALEKKGIRAWVPLQKMVRQWGRVVRTVERPLINCYVFVKITKEAYLPVLETEHVAGFIRFNQNLIAIPEEEIEVLRRITLENDVEVQAVAGYFGEGDAVKIAKGNLTGLQGRVAKIEGKHRLVVELTHIGCSLLLTVDASFLQKAN